MTVGAAAHTRPAVPSGPLPRDPLVTVVVPLFDMAGYVGEALASVRASTHRRWECLVVDDGSTDGSAAVVAAVAREDDRVRLLAKANGGPLSCLALAAREARGEVVVLLDADDLMSPRRLEAVIAAFRSRPDAGFAVHRLAVTDGRARVVGLSPGTRRLPAGDLAPVVLAHGSGVPHLGVSSGFAFRAEALDAVLPPPTLPRRFPDEYLRRVVPLVTRVVAIEEVLGVRRLHAGSLTARRRDRLASDLAAACADYRLLDEALARVAGEQGLDDPGAGNADVLRLEWVTARLRGERGWRDRWRALAASPGFTALRPASRLYWRVARHAPGPVFRALVQARAQSAGPRLAVSWVRMMRDARFRPPAGERAPLHAVLRLVVGRG